MFNMQHLVPHILDLVDGFVNVTVLPPRSGLRPRSQDPVVVCSRLGIDPAAYRVLPERSTNGGRTLCAFREVDSAMRVATAMRGEVVAVPAGFPEMLDRTCFLAAAYSFAQQHYPGTPLVEIPEHAAFVVAGDFACTYLERAIAVLASTRPDLGALPATVWATTLIDAFGFTESTPWLPPATERAARSNGTDDPGHDHARIRQVADAYAIVRATYPNEPLELLVNTDSRVSVLRSATPRTRAIGLACVALGPTDGVWNIARAEMLIDQAEPRTIARVLSAAHGGSVSRAPQPRRRRGAKR